MKTNKNISIDIEILKEMLEYCEKYNVSFSKLVVDLWTYFKTCLIDNFNRDPKCTGKLSIKNPAHPNYQAITRGNDEKKE